MADFKIFISYRRDDCGGHAPALVGRIYDRLSERYGNENVFMDVDTIPPGVDFTEHLGQAVRKADVLLAVVGPDWVRLLRERADQASDFVKVELEQALQQSIPVVPLLVARAPMPQENELPDSMKSFVLRNAYPVNSGRDFNAHMTRLMDELDSHFGNAASSNAVLGAPRSAVTNQERPSGPSRWLPLAVAFLALIAVVGVAIHFLGPDDRQSSSGDVVPSNATKAAPFVNTQGMKFVPVEGTNALFSIWETRVGDFEAFVNAKGHKAESGMFSLDDADQGWVQLGKTWKDPGDSFEQTTDHPVVGVSWNDATAFCEWLSEKEGMTYRLPTNQEWNALVAGTKYPRGDQFPPPPGTENLAGSEARTGSWPVHLVTIEGHSDNHPRTAPVGSYTANRFGIYDLGGNAYEWCQDWYRKEMNPAAVRSENDFLNEDGGGQTFRVMRGGSWVYGFSGKLLTASSPNVPSDRYSYYGFRCVLELP